MPLHRTKLLDRKLEVRDAVLFIIATEGEKTETSYFDGFQSPRIHVEVLPTGPDHKSSPNHVLSRLSLFEEQYNFGEGDELWLVLDVDRWKPANLKQVCAEGISRGYGLAISNPCFEFWLLMHFSDNNLSTPEFKTLINVKNGNRSEAAETWLRRTMQERGGYQKANLNFEVFRPFIPDAIQRARDLDTKPEDRWPTTFPGTHV